MSLKQVAEKIGKELTRTNFPGTSVYAPHLREYGVSLLEASGDIHEMRDDVSRFARKMSAVMNAKAKEKAGGEELTASAALCELQFQLGKFQQHPFPGNQEIERILVHIANYAMIAMDAMERDKVFK